MEPLDSLYRWSDRMRDKARAGAFLRFLARRFNEDDLFQAAGALSFTTVFALVPLSMVVFGVLSGFPLFAEWSERLSDYIFSNFVPTAARSVEDYLLQFSTNAGQLTVAGVIALVVSLLITLNGVEAAFNRIWRVHSHRPKLGRFLVYWTVLTLGALVAAASLALSARFFALSIFDTSAGHVLEDFMLRAAPMALELLAIASIYKVVPHRTVHWRHAIAGAVLATLLFELVKSGIGLYLGTFGNYSRIYGTLAFVPIFLLWIFLSWIAVLLGASLASSISAFRYQPVSMRLPHGYEFYGLLRLLARFNEARRHGRGLHTDEIQQLEPILTDALVQDMLGQLVEINVVRRAEGGEWLLARDLDGLPLSELYEACHLRIPIAEAHLPCRDDALGQSAVDAMDELRVPLRNLLKRRVGTIHAEEE
ncbi:YihY family inner membrane protein [Lysobacter sp. F60174L2]|uniref:YihY family inner membrane protein n=1 Tax=Lysobacter sp. F60174L2 TaxID=3459295 RepID=UPI00403D9235